MYVGMIYVVDFFTPTITKYNIRGHKKHKINENCTTVTKHFALMNNLKKLAISVTKEMWLMLRNSKVKLFDHFTVTSLCMIQLISYCNV